MRISDVLDKSKIKVFLEGTSKREVIEELAELLLDAHTVEQRARAVQQLFEREADCSTGIGAGVAKFWPSSTSLGFSLLNRRS